MTAQLLTFAEFEFKLLQITEGEKTLKDHLEQLEATTGITPDALVNPTHLPPELEHVYGWFCELSNARSSSFSGLDPITFPGIESWMRVTGIRPGAHEIELIRKIDNLYRTVNKKK